MKVTGISCYISIKFNLLQVEGGLLMRYSYPAYFIKEESGYLVFFPDLDNIATCGCNFAQATYMAMDCLALYLCSCLEDDKTLPPPSPIKSLHLSDFLQNELNDIPYSDAFCQMICVDTDEYEQALHAGTAQVLVELPDFLLREIDDNNLDVYKRQSYSSATCTSAFLWANSTSARRWRQSTGFNRIWWSSPAI